MLTVQRTARVVRLPSKATPVSTIASRSCPSMRNAWFSLLSSHHTAEVMSGSHLRRVQMHAFASHTSGPEEALPPTTTNVEHPLARVRNSIIKAIKEFPVTWVYMFTYLSFMLLIPILALLVRASQIPLHIFLARATEPIAMHAYYVTFTMAVAASLVNAVFGFILAWVLVKYKFPGRRLLDAAVDLPFALPTSVAGLTLISVYSEEGLLGALLAKLGVNVVFSRLGVAVAMVFVSFPFVVRTMQPVLQEMEKEQIEAAWSLGASPWKTFVEVIFPPLIPALLTGTALAFSRAIGEFGSIVIVSSNFAFKDLIAPVLIFQCLEQYDFVGATVIGTVMLLTSLLIMLVVNWLQGFSQRYRK